MNNLSVQINLLTAIKVILLLIIIRLLYPNNVFSQIIYSNNQSTIHTPILSSEYSNNFSNHLNEERKKLSPNVPILDNIIQNTAITVSTALPLQYTRDNTSSQQPLPLVYNISASVNARYSYQNFFADLSIIKYAYKQPWNSDFTYVFGYDDWHTNTFSFQYANYSNNRINPSQGERFTRFEQGSFSTSYKFLYPNFTSKSIDDQNRVNGSIGLSVVPKYYNSIENKKKYLRYIVSIGASYQLIPRLNLGISLLHYVKKEPQASWEPDFTYTLSYSIPLNSGSITLSYQNYNGTRYPWRKNHRNFLAIKDGAIGIAFSTNLNHLLNTETRKN